MNNSQPNRGTLCSMMTSLIWILVFPWIQALTQTCPSSYSQPNMKLQGHVIKAYSALQTSDQCIDKCALHADCHSINYWSSQGICEVNNANHLSNPEGLVYSAGCQYVNYFLRAVSRCSNKLCSYPLHCVIDKTTKQSYKCSYCESGNTTVLSFPRKSISDKVVYINDAVDIKSFTLGMWVQVDPSTSRHAPFSYATEGKPNEILVYLRHVESFLWMKHGIVEAYAKTVIDGRWHHICVTWENVQGNFEMYIDGIKEVNQTSVEKGHIIKKGAVVLGQDQDSYMGGFSVSESFQGNLTGVNMWDRVFTAQEVSAIADRCSSSQGNVLKWADLQHKSSGNVALICERFCNSNKSA